MAVEIETALSPETLLKLLKKLESETGREPAVRWGPRVIDLDILLYDDLVLETPEYRILISQSGNFFWSLFQK